MQMPSGATPAAQTRRFDRLPSAPMSNAVSVPAKDSAMTSVELSGVTTMPLANAIPSATCRTEPSGVISAIAPGRNSSAPKRKPTLLT
jgi:hypothetical protein